jgi:hypothetical protein
MKTRRERERGVGERQTTRKIQAGASHPRTWYPQLDAKELAHVSHVLFDSANAVEVVPHTALVERHHEVKHLR